MDSQKLRIWFLFFCFSDFPSSLCTNLTRTKIDFSSSKGRIYKFFLIPFGAYPPNCKLLLHADNCLFSFSFFIEAPINRTALWPGTFMILLSCLHYLCIEVALNVQFLLSVISVGMALYHLWNGLYCITFMVSLPLINTLMLDGINIKNTW